MIYAGVPSFFGLGSEDGHVPYAFLGSQNGDELGLPSTPTKGRKAIFQVLGMSR